MSEIEFLVGEVVAEVRDDCWVIFKVGDDSQPRVYASVANAVCADADGASLPLADLVGRSVAAATTDCGALTLEFVDGASLLSQPDPRFEAWEVVGGNPQYLVVCQPGGELAVWDERYNPSREEAEQTVKRLFGPDWRLHEVTESGRITAERESPSED